MAVPEHAEELSLNETLAQCCRVMHALGLTDLRGTASGREGEDTFALAPATVMATDAVRAQDVATCSINQPSTNPNVNRDREIALHAAIYQRRPDVGGIVHTCQPWAMIFGIAQVPFLPVTHQESDLALEPAPVWKKGRLPANDTERAEFLEVLGNANFCHLPGEGVLIVGPSPRAAVVRAHYLELLARNSFMAKVLARGLGKDEADMGLVSTDDVRRHLSERPGWDHFWRYYASLDPAERFPRASEPQGEVPDASEEALRQKLALSCRILYRYGLNAYLEHVSIRRPGRDEFFMNPLGDLSRMEAGDLATVTFDSEWVDGPVKPPGHKWLHAEIFRSRPEVQAIVHTHQPLARIFAILGEKVPAVHLPGVSWVHREAPIHPSPDLLFDRERAARVVQVLGDGDIVHQRGHGIEYLSDTIEAATFAALAVERQCQFTYMALQLRGSKEGLFTIAEDAFGGDDISPESWWNYFVSQLEGPVPAWASPYPIHW